MPGQVRQPTTDNSSNMSTEITMTAVPRAIEQRLVWACGLFLAGAPLALVWLPGGLLLLAGCVGLSVRSLRLLAIWDAAEAAKEEARLQRALAVAEEEESFAAEVERRMEERVL